LTPVASIVRVHIFFVNYSLSVFKIVRQESKCVQCALNRHVHCEVASDNKFLNCTE